MGLSSSLLAAGTSSVGVDVVFRADTRDVHISVAGKITKVTLPPALMPSSSETNIGNYGVGFNAPPGAGTYRFSIDRMGTGKWGGKIQLTTDGSGLATPVVVPDQRFASLYPDDNFGVTGIVTLLADNGDSPNGLSLTNIQVAVLADIDSLDDPDFGLPGTIVNFPNATLGAGATDVSIGSLNLASTDGLRVTANYNGVPMTYLYVVPEVGSAGMAGAVGAVALLRRRRA